MTKRPYEITQSQIVWSCPWYQVRQDKIRLPDGRTGEYNVVEKAPAVFVLPITTAGEIVLIRVYRHTTDTWCWELPAGSVKEGQTFAESAVAELREEIGGTAETLTLIGEFATANGFCNERTQVFVAEGVTLGETDHEPLEVMTIHCKSAAEVQEMVLTGQMEDGFSALTILLAAAKGFL